MDEREFLAERFEEQRGHLRAVAYRMLGSLSEADDAVQEAWLRLSRTDTSEVENLDGWLTTVVARVSLNMLRSRKTRREDPIGHSRARPDHRPRRRHRPGARGAAGRLGRSGAAGGARDAEPAERLAFVLHDMFAVPFDEIAPIVDRSPEAARQLASRARRRVRAENTAPDADVDAQREVVDAFLAASRDGDFDRLRRGSRPRRRPESRLRPGQVARGPRRGRGGRPGEVLHAARARHEAGAGQRRGGGGHDAGRPPFSVGAFTVKGGRIVEMDWLADAERLRELDLTILDA